MLNSIRKVNTLRGLKKDIRNFYFEFLKFKRKKIIKDYFKANSITKLHLGSSITQLKGWLCSDLIPQNNQSIYLDVSKKFPFADDTFDYIYSEHLIEHLQQKDAFSMLTECFRVVKKGGRIRLATPDLEVIAKLYSDRNIGYGKEYIKWIVDNFTQNLCGYSSVPVVNALFHNWGHQFLYDFEFLKILLLKCGFENIEKYLISQSKDLNLQNIERHHENVGNPEMVEFETLVVEAVKI